MLVQEVLVLDVPANRKEGYNFYKINEAIWEVFIWVRIIDLRKCTPRVWVLWKSGWIRKRFNVE